MSVTRLTQLLSESSSWKRLLGFLMEENTHCKNRLSEILNNDFQIRLLADMENFQTGFLQTDTMITFLRSEVAEFDKIILKPAHDQQAFSAINGQLKKIRHDISVAEINSNRQQTDFHGYLTDNL